MAAAPALLTTLEPVQNITASGLQPGCQFNLYLARLALLCYLQRSAEVVPANMKRLCEAVAHPGFGVLLHFRGNDGDGVMAPWAMHTHISWEIVEHDLEAHMQQLRAAGYQGCWSVEHHSGQHEYSEGRFNWPRFAMS